MRKNIVTSLYDTFLKTQNFFISVIALFHDCQLKFMEKTMSYQCVSNNLFSFLLRTHYLFRYCV